MLACGSLLVSLGACASRPRVTTAPAAPPLSLPAESRRAVYVDDLDEFLRGGLSGAEAVYKREAAIVQCMTAKGWKLPPAVMPSTTDEPTKLAERRLVRSTRGFLGKEAVILPKGAISPLLPEQRSRYALDMFGTSTPSGGGDDTGGCRLEAANVIRTAVPIEDPAIAKRVQGYIQTVLGDGHLAAAEKRWKACMSNAGQLAESPDEIANKSKQEFAANKLALKAMIDAALADHDCYAVEVAPVRSKIEAPIIAELLAAFPRFRAIVSQMAL